MKTKLAYIAIGVMAAFLAIIVIDKVRYSHVDSGSVLRQIAMVIIVYQDSGSKIAVDDAIRWAQTEDPTLQSKMHHIGMESVDLQMGKANGKGNEVLLKWKSLAVYCDGHVGNISRD